MPNPSRPIPPALLYILHSAFTLMVPAYALLYFFLLSARPATAAHPAVSAALLLCALICIPAGFFLPNFLTPKPSVQLSPSAAFLIQCYIKMILSDAFFEAIAIYGLVGGFLGIPRSHSFILMAVGFVLLLVNFVRVRGWIDAYELLRRQDEKR